VEKGSLLLKKLSGSRKVRMLTGAMMSKPRNLGKWVLGGKLRGVRRKGGGGAREGGT